MDFNLQEECQNLIEVGWYTIPGEIDVSSLDPESVVQSHRCRIDTIAIGSQPHVRPHVHNLYLFTSMNASIVSAPFHAKLVERWEGQMSARFRVTH